MVLDIARLALKGRFDDVEARFGQEPPIGLGIIRAPRHACAGPIRFFAIGRVRGPQGREKNPVRLEEPIDPDEEVAMLRSRDVKNRIEGNDPVETALGQDSVQKVAFTIGRRRHVVLCERNMLRGYVDPRQIRTAVSEVLVDGQSRPAAEVEDLGVGRTQAKKTVEIVPFHRARQTISPKGGGIVPLLIALLYDPPHIVAHTVMLSGSDRRTTGLASGTQPLARVAAGF
jgi:hypothetical protein